MSFVSLDGGPGPGTGLATDTIHWGNMEHATLRVIMCFCIVKSLRTSSEKKERQCSNVWTTGTFYQIIIRAPQQVKFFIHHSIILRCDFMSKLNHSGNRIIPWGAGQQCSLCPRPVSPCCSIVVSGLGIRHDLSGYQGSRHCPPCPPWSDPNNKMEIIVLFSSNICQIFQTINNQLTLSTRGKEL